MSPTNQQLGADLDAWCWQIQTLEDLAVFVSCHGPACAVPLPVLHWTLGTGRHAAADVHPGTDTDPVGVLHAYANALGSTVEALEQPGKVTYRVRGHVGRLDGAKRHPRTGLLIRATVFHPLEAEEPGR